jgi:phosphotransferase system enzyme I (PtsI)
MHPASLLQVKQQILKAHLDELGTAAQRLLKNTDPDKTAVLLGRLNG